MTALKTGLRELVRECFKVKSVVMNRFGIGSSSPWILFGMKLFLSSVQYLCLTYCNALFEYEYIHTSAIFAANEKVHLID